MPNKTSIPWTDRTSNPIYAVDKVTGKRGWFCTKVSEGCGSCYAEKLNMRFGNRLAFTVLNSERIEWRLNEKELAAIQRLQEPQRIFIEDMGDPFHPDVPSAFKERLFFAMHEAPQHTFQVLTKRIERAQAILTNDHFRRRVAGSEWPLPNVWLGVSVENQARADERIPLLLDTPAAVRFVSAEPLLGPLDLRSWTHEPTTTFIPAAPGGVSYGSYQSHTPGCGPGHRCGPGLDWVIVGGESGGPEDRRLVERCRHLLSGEAYMGRCFGCEGTGWRPKPEALEWVRDIRDQCRAAGVAFFLKQLGPRAGQGTLLDGKKYQEMPEVQA